MVAACQPNPRRRGAGEPKKRRLATVRGESSQKLVGLPVRIRQLTSQAAGRQAADAAKKFAAFVISEQLDKCFTYCLLNSYCVTVPSVHPQNSRFGMYFNDMLKRRLKPGKPFRNLNDSSR